MMRLVARSLSLLPLFSLPMLLSGCGGGTCDGVARAPVDYAQASSWICRPGRDDACSKPRTIYDVKRDGSVEKREERPAPGERPIDCFYVYPTMDLRLRRGVHEDLGDLEQPTRAARTQAARFGDVCAVYAPAYRQVTLGTYADAEEGKLCFEAAYRDVRAAFDHYLENDNKGRGIVLVGHSQGAQILSRLLRERFDKDPELRARLVVAMPIGWQIGGAKGEKTGGAFENLPLCTRQAQTGCFLHYRSYAAGNKASVGSDVYREGEGLACHNPASPEAPETAARLAYAEFSTKFVVDNLPDNVPEDAEGYVRYADAFEARCVSAGAGTRGLEVAWSPKEGDKRVNPIDFSRMIYSGSLGTHILDFAFGQADLAADIERRAKAWQLGRSEPQK